MQIPRVKVYGFLRPCQIEGFRSLRVPLRLLGDAADNVLELDGGLLNVAYEGAFFPLEEFMEALAPLVRAESKGKVDYMDMEDWKITRYSIENGFITRTVRGLNDTLAHSGH